MPLVPIEPPVLQCSSVSSLEATCDPFCQHQEPGPVARPDFLPHAETVLVLHSQPIRIIIEGLHGRTM